MNTKLNAKLNTANVANNLTTTASGYALDARQGKSLNDIISAMSPFLWYNATSNGNVSDALLVDLSNKNGDANKPRTILSSASNVPYNLAWGVREVFWISTNQIVVRITGIENDGTSNIWTVSYNFGSWTGWRSLYGNDYFYPNSSYTITQAVMPGLITNSGKDIMFTLHFPKILKDITTFDIQNFSFIIRGEGNTYYTLSSFSGISAGFLWNNGGNTITIVIYLTSSLGINNIACTCQVEKATVLFY